MCFYKSTERKDSKLKTATKAIIVYKGLNGIKNLKSPYQNTIWTEKKTLTEKYFVRDARGYSTVSTGFHSAKTWNRAKFHGTRVFEFVIPKGAKYYENETEYVSDKIYLRSAKSVKKPKS